MAVWMVRILDGADPGAVGSSRFADVDPLQWWAPHVERLAELGVTKGCATEPARFCPAGTVTRAQMASFLVRAFSLPPASPAGFADVGSGVHTADINALAASGITVGCGTEPLSYCPARDTNRAQMATFLARALNIGEPTDNTDPDRETLVALSNATDGTNWTDDTNWLTDTPISEWYGVVADDDARVTLLDLRSNQLRGEIPASLGELASLEWLTLSDNQLTGRIPPELAALTKLESLYLHTNQLTGAIPPGLGRLTDLITLSLHNNRLTGTIPPELAGLSNLEELALSHNQLTGAIPPELGTLTRLQTLAVFPNQLTGCIPPSLRDVAANDLGALRLPDCEETTEPATEGKAVTGDVTECSGSRTRLGSTTFLDVTVAGTVTAHRSVSSVRVEAKVGISSYFPDVFDPLWHHYITQERVGTETIGSMKAGDVRDFSIEGSLINPFGLRCFIQVTWDD